MPMTLWEMRGSIREAKPNCTPAAANQFVNKRIRMALDRWRFSDLLRRGVIVVPDAYRDGAVSLTPGSAAVSGTLTNWPVNDLVATTLSAPSRDVGYVGLRPASMANIRQGMYLVIEAETPANTEILPVMSAEVDNFTCLCSKPHGAGVSVQASSLANLQLWINDHRFTVTGVLSPTSLVLDMPWGGPAVTDNAYVIYLAFAQITPTARHLKYAFDCLSGSVLGVGGVIQWADQGDPQRTSTGDPEQLLMMPPHPSGVMQWEIWPRQDSGRLINVVYDDGWPKLAKDNDLSPHFVNPEVFVAGAQADALRTRVIPNLGKTDPYYDPAVAQDREREFEQMLEGAIQMDSGRYQQMLGNYIDQAVGLTSYNGLRSQVGWPTESE